MLYFYRPYLPRRRVRFHFDCIASAPASTPADAGFDALHGRAALFCAIARPRNYRRREGLMDAMAQMILVYAHASQPRRAGQRQRGEQPATPLAYFQARTR